MTVEELLRRISSRELTEWAAYFQLEPWGCEVEDWRAGMIASVIANVNRDPKKHRRAYRPADFMPRRGPQPEQTEEEQERIIEAWARIFEAKFDEGGS